MSFQCRMEWKGISRRGFPIPMIAAGLLLFFSSVPVRAQSQELALQFVPSTTSVEFTLGDVLHTVHGSFGLKSGDVRYSPQTGAVRGSVIVDAPSGQSGNRMRDRRMHREILESERYPEIAFRPDQVDGKVAMTGTSTIQVHGIFSMHGSDHELTVPVTVQMFPDHWIADSHFTIPYVKWGVKNPSTFLLRVSESVEIDVHATGANPSGAAGAH